MLQHHARTESRCRMPDLHANAHSSAVIRSTEPTPFWCSPTVQAQSDEAHPELLQAISDRSTRMQLYTVGLFAVPESSPDGFISLAVDPKTDETFAVYHLSEGEVVATMWFIVKGGVEAALRFFTGQLETQGII